MFFRRKTIDAEITGLERRREGLDQQLRNLETKLVADHADAPPARRDALVDDFARLKAEIASKLTATDALLANLRDQKREQEAAAARLEADRQERELLNKRTAIAERMIAEAAAVDAALAAAASAAARLHEAAGELAHSGVPDTSRVINRGAFTRAMRAAGLAQYGDVDYMPQTIVKPLRDAIRPRLAPFLEPSGTAVESAEAA